MAKVTRKIKTISTESKNDFDREVSDFLASNNIISKVFKTSTTFTGTFIRTQYIVHIEYLAQVEDDE